MRKRLFSWMSMAVLAAILVSCGEDTPAPVVEIFFEADESDPYTVNFTTISTDATSFAWDFGDGESGSGDAPSHTYAISGDYTVTVSATGEGGETEATREITIAASLSEIISGGPSAASGKTWVLSRTTTPGLDGAGTFDPSFPADLMPGTDNVLDIIGLGDEYDNEYTFYHDGSYEIDNINGINMASWVYSNLNVAQEDWVTTTAYGIFAVKSTPPGNATWSITEATDLVVDAVDENPDGTGTPKTVTFEAADYITFENDGFILLQDLSVHAIIRDATSERMTLSVFMHSVLPESDKPSHILTFTFDAK